MAGDHVEDARRHTGTLGQFGKRERRERRLGRGVADDRAARRQRRARLARQHRARKVPGRDERRDTDRLAPQLDLGVRQVTRHALDVRALGLLGVELDESGAIVDLAPRFRQGLALLADHDPGEVFLVRAHQVEPAAQDGRTLLRQKPGPRRKGRLGRVDGCGGFGRGQARDLAHGLAGRGIGHADRLAGRGGAPFAADIGEAADKFHVGNVQAGRDCGIQHLILVRKARMKNRRIAERMGLKLAMPAEDSSARAGFRRPGRLKEGWRRDRPRPPASVGR